eukprot:CAMPEP_0183601614 /NCGR_PEP_ID=MMETSP0371-20130417/180533_1 /TAXON_ID=268820 /ORGANISM="Peridinium aciculiferum, Strain PAER-2" /LENGTH=237 /DNA_ID=CAMNT_0025813707 /DNA_START=448 /DNA_END=1161 /DNA_ORIENTATION=-
MTIGPNGGILHGTWTADASVTTSDRRLKRSIVPLYRAISQSVPRSQEQAQGRAEGSGGAAAAALRGSSGQQPSATSTRAPGKERADAISWVLRELRPVSFNFKDGPEAKYSRYGFVAQELQQVLPAVVRGEGEEHLKVAYQDLIALLTLAAQVLQDRVNQLSDALQKQEASTQTLLEYVKKLDAKIERVLVDKHHEELVTSQAGDQRPTALEAAHAPAPTGRTMATEGRARRAGGLS